MGEIKKSGVVWCGVEYVLRNSLFKAISFFCHHLKQSFYKEREREIFLLEVEQRRSILFNSTCGVI